MFVEPVGFLWPLAGKLFYICQFPTENKITSSVEVKQIPRFFGRVLFTISYYFSYRYKCSSQPNKRVLSWNKRVHGKNYENNM